MGEAVCAGRFDGAEDIFGYHVSKLRELQVRRGVLDAYLVFLAAKPF
jgi:hypothetical protein